MFYSILAYAMFKIAAMGTMPVKDMWHDQQQSCCSTVHIFFPLFFPTVIPKHVLTEQQHLNGQGQSLVGHIILLNGENHIYKV
jgi:hypothetical protein